MEKLISELHRLYLPVAAAVTPQDWQRHLDGQAPLPLAPADGKVRAAAMAFPFKAGQEEGQHWNRLCDAANELQTRFGLPAPAVSVSGDSGYCLWLSLESPAPASLVQDFVSLLQAAVMPDVDAPPPALPPLPPCLHPATDKWSAFIHPGMGASFADGSGLDVAPPLAGQVGFLEGLHSISAAQFADVLGRLRAGTATEAAPPAPQEAAPGLLLKDATLEDIVRHLHSKNIEPSFRFLK
ncbi:hypothetical protein GCM10027277_01580 [Pseudoduganella ginsengisoli]|uniref:Uncharacterized protein n=1 Tax=Pseudoduganella ginsengisoli TaxID=1462440 RepID=A0A6L6QA90_9BURK|nr:hypothetical protein [Pseudoduganella ginsengisoli]MTW06108.1 hypothetical protein [Pseudoduganella ginsengisoli]